MERRYSVLMGRSPGGAGGGGGEFGGRPGRRRRGWRWYHVAILLVALMITGGVIYVVTSVSSAIGKSYHPISEDVAPEVRAAPVRAGERINILLMALDDDQYHTDVMMLASIDPEQKRVGVIQIPRDTRTLLAGKNTIEKINAAYTYGVGDEAFPPNLRALKSVEDLLDIRINYTVVLDMEGFRRAIDEIGGVTVDIPIKMEYDDPYQDLHIHFEPGRQKLNGQKALEYVRWRKNNDGTGYPDADLGRMRAQEAFIRTVMDQVLKPGNLVSLPNLISKLARYVESTIEPNRLLNLATLVAQMDRAAIESAMLPGEPASVLGSSYYIHDPVQTRKLVARLVHGIEPQAAAPIRVEVAAALGDERAPFVVQRLKEQGFDATLGAAPAGALPAKTRVVPIAADKSRSLLVSRGLIAQGFEVELVEEHDPKAGGVVRVILGTDR